MSTLNFLENVDVCAQTTLFINHSNGIAGSWTISLRKTPEGYGLLEMKITKVIGGKSSSRYDLISKGKNLGKANETTAFQQAEKEYASRINKKLLKGYTETMPEAGVASLNGLGLDKPMLAKELEDFDPARAPFGVQPKLDGNRCLARRVNGKVVLWSRGGKKLSVKHISKQLEPIMTDDTPTLDGELYVHGLSLQAITSLIKKPREESSSLQYVVYDCISPETYMQRLNILNAVFKRSTESPDIKLIETTIVNSVPELDKLHRRYVRRGFEGTMIRMLDVGYETGKRSRSLIKMKDFQDAEFKIIDVVSGKPNYVVTATDEQIELQVAIYVCETSDGNTFTVTAEGTIYEKHAAWERRELAIGQMLKVQFFNWTADGIPFLPTSLGIWEPL